MMVNLPSGTGTFLFIDNERLPKGNPVNRGWCLGRDEAQPSLVKHDEVIHQAIEANGGYLYKRIGDAFQAAFSTAPDAVQAAFEAMHQVASTEHRVPSDVTSVLGTRMALHTGVAEPHEGDYASPLLNRVARLLSAGHAGQVLLTLATQELARDAMPPGVAFK